MLDGQSIAYQEKRLVSDRIVIDELGNRLPELSKMSNRVTMVTYISDLFFLGNEMRLERAELTELAKIV